MITTTLESLSTSAGLDRFGEIFSGSRTDLQWLAGFVTANETVAEACVIDACGLTESQLQRSDDVMMEWQRHATIRAAIEIQRVRISQISSTYETRRCRHRSHARLSQDAVDLVIDEGSRLVTALDVLCRCALVLCGIEKFSLRETAALLGVNKKVARAAYCTALDYLDVLRCERFRNEYACAAVWN
jgi:DNA-directed RNA polymerase specialized sigma24 family protein